MELSQTVLDGLSLVSHERRDVDKDRFTTILDHVVQELIGERKKGEVDGTVSLRNGKEKLLSVSLGVLLAEAAKMDASNQMLSSLLEDCQIEPDFRQIIITAYQNQSQKIRTRLGELTMDEIPSLLDVNWTQCHVFKHSTEGNITESRFLIELRTDSNVQPTLRFECTREGLQDLSVKLREACKAAERNLNLLN